MISTMEKNKKYSRVNEIRRSRSRLAPLKLTFLYVRGRTKVVKGIPKSSKQYCSHLL